jgi:hypothetical protein
LNETINFIFLLIITHLQAIEVFLSYYKKLAKVYFETSAVETKYPLAVAPLACTFLSGILCFFNKKYFIFTIL